MTRRAAAVALLALSTGAVAAPGGFTVRLEFTPRAAAKLAQMGESVTVAAYYSGDPKPAFRRRADKEGKIDLGQDRITAPGRAGQVRIPAALTRVHLGWIKSAPQVLINVYSARRKGPDNILDCGIYESGLSQIVAKGATIRCDLIPPLAARG